MSETDERKTETELNIELEQIDRPLLKILHHWPPYPYSVSLQGSKNRLTPQTTISN